MRALLLVALLLVPVAGADHVFGHRVYVVGRVVDVSGTPVAGAAVDVALEGVTDLGACFDAQDPRTGARGDYTVCRHVHEVPPRARAAVAVAGAAREVEVDPLLRHAVANVQLASPAPSRDITGEREFAQAIRVTGRSFTAWPRPEDSEGVLVNATPLGDPIVVRLLEGERVLADANATVDEHGLYSVDLDVRELPAGALVRVSNGREGAEAVASTLFRRVDLNLLRDLTLSEGQGEGAPGSKTPWPLSLTVAAIALAAVVAPRAKPRRRR